MQQYVRFRGAVYQLVTSQDDNGITVEFYDRLIRRSMTELFKLDLPERPGGKRWEKIGTLGTGEPYTLYYRVAYVLVEDLKPGAELDAKLLGMVRSALEPLAKKHGLVPRAEQQPNEFAMFLSKHTVGSAYRILNESTIRLDIRVHAGEITVSFDYYYHDHETGERIG